MSNPVLPSNVVTKAFSSVVVSLPNMPAGKGSAGVMAGIEKLREDARREGAQLGFSDGQAKGFDAGYEEGLRQGREEAARLALQESQQVGAALAQEMGHLHAQVEEGWANFIQAAEAAMTDRCLDTVRALLNAELQLGRESALPIVQRCLSEIVHANSIKIRVAAEDLPYLRDHVNDERVELVADGSIGFGCRIESSSGTIDGTLSTSLELLEAAWDEAA